MESFKKSTIDPRAFVILDDCLYDGSWAKDKMMRLLFMNGRHWKIMLIITMQLSTWYSTKSSYKY